MNTIIADKLHAEQTISSNIDNFFNQFLISRLMKMSNFYKESGIPCVSVLKEIFSLVFSGKNLYRTLEMESERLPFRKNTAYRFLNSSRYNWSRLLMKLATIITFEISKTTSEDRVNVLIVDDSFYDRGRSKNVELLSRVFDHTTHKFVKGFRMLTLGWSDGNTFIPAAFSLLSARQDKNILCPVNSGIDKRHAGYKKRVDAVALATDTMFKLLDSVKHLHAKYVLFDSWFAFPKTICGIVARNRNVICMIKNSSRIHYFYQGEWMDVKRSYSRLKIDTSGNICGSATAFIRESKKNPNLVEVKIVFVNNRQKSNFLAVLSTDTLLSDDEIIRIYGKRWDIEVFFKSAKSMLALAKEFQGRSYDMMTAHTTIVFMRYIMLALEARNSSDKRTVGGFFYQACEEACGYQIFSLYVVATGYPQANSIRILSFK